MSQTPVMEKDAAKPLAAYSAGHVVNISPDLALLYISGTTARQADGQIPPFGFSFSNSMKFTEHEGLTPAAVQARIVLEKISSIISNASKGSGGLENLVELTIFVKDLQNDYGVINDVYNAMVGQKFRELGTALPARTCVQVSGMPPDERTLVEMKGVARIQGCQ
ncbi:unnamed protein product [Clonostachys rosea]|uniref:Uncharacterized protein n=1 Tax=Bionectria ochroleuca TaxID=29856 RepID=A0ABY6TZ56_BIOOC|nr:unnamed protein product [Clonostachys rosea]